LSGGEQTGSVQSVSRALDLLEELAGTPSGLGVTDLARRSELPQGTTHRLLRTLLAQGWVRQQADRRYVLGARLIPVGAAAERSLAGGAHRYLAELVAVSGESANLAVLEGDHVAYVAQVASPHRLRMFAEAGNRVPAHSTGVGKLLLAQLGGEQVQSLLHRTGLPARTPQTVTSVEALRRELAEVRAAGHALDRGEEESWVRCIAVGVPGPGGAVVAAMSVSGPEARFGAEAAEALLPDLHRVADRFGASLAEQTDPPTSVVAGRRQLARLR